MAYHAEYFPSQLLEDSPVEVEIGNELWSHAIRYVSVKDNKDENKKYFYKVVFKGDKENILRSVLGLSCHYFESKMSSLYVLPTFNNHFIYIASSHYHVSLGSLQLVSDLLLFF